MEKNNVNVLFENGTKQVRYYPMLAKELNAMIEYMDHPLFGAAWDVGHAHIESKYEFCPFLPGPFPLSNPTFSYLKLSYSIKSLSNHICFPNLIG